VTAETHDHDLTMRPITGPEELGLFNRLAYAFDDELADDLAAGRRRPRWLWVATRGDRLVARLAWWARGRDDAHPMLLDVLDVDDTAGTPADRTATAVRLLRRASAEVLPVGTRPPEYTRFVPGDWRDRPGTRRAVEERMAALERTGARLLVERRRLEWRPGTPVAAPDGRLVFRPPHGTGELLDLMTAAVAGTLDAHHREALAGATPREVAVGHYEGELARYTSPRAWWRVAQLPDGEPVGFVLPAHNGYHPIIAYLAVLPAHRGKGWIDGVLAEGTRVLAGEGVPRIRASTDLGNVPMADAFARAGYATFERQISMVWPG